MNSPFITCVRSFLLLFPHFLALFVLLPITEVECASPQNSLLDDGTGTLNEGDIERTVDACVESARNTYREAVRTIETQQERHPTLTGTFEERQHHELNKALVFFYSVKKERNTSDCQEVGALLRRTVSLNQADAPSTLTQVSRAVSEIGQGIGAALSGLAPQPDPNLSPKAGDRPGSFTYFVAPDKETVENISSSGVFTPEFKAPPL